MMTPLEFKSLRYGNTIQDPLGNNWIVSLVIRDKDNLAQRVALVPALALDKSSDWTVVSKDRAVSFITGQTINEPE